MARVLVIDDHDAMREGMAVTLESGHEVAAVHKRTAIDEGVALLPALLVVLAASGCAPSPHQVGLRSVDDLAPTTIPDPRSPLVLAKERAYREGQEGVGTTLDTSEGRWPSNIILAAGSRPPPRTPSLPPRPPGQGNQRDQRSEPTRPGYVPGRRLAGPPDAPYWEPVLEIPWRGGPLQGPRSTPPQRAPGEAGGPVRPAPRPPQQQPGQSPSRPPVPTPQPNSQAARNTAGILGRSFGQLGTVVENPGLAIKGFQGSATSGHALNQIINRGVSPELLQSTVTSPSLVLRQGGRYLFLSRRGAVVMTSEGQVVTAWTERELQPHILEVLREAGVP